MSKNYLIGIGGTGARAIESIIYMCASGYGPDELSVFLIDPDSGNGNLGRTISLIKSYIECFNELNVDSLKDRKIFKTKISIPKEDKEICWSIFEDDANSTLSSYIEYSIFKEGYKDSNIGDLVDILFSENELKEPLNNGFRGHPSIGSVVMSSPPEGKEPFKSFFKDISGSEDIKVFLIGSIFGGTGAAGVPTFGSEKIIKELGKISEDKNNVMLGTSLVLPYFSFDVNNELLKEKMYVTNEDYPIASKGALEYYYEKGLAFDKLYFIGDSLLQKVGNASSGSGTQKNDPHYIEIVIGLAAFDFFKQKFIKNNSEKQYFIAARKNKSVSWDELPVSSAKEFLAGRQNSFKLLTVAFTTFAYSFVTYGSNSRKPLQDMENKENYIEQTWYKDNHFHKINKKTLKETDIRYSENEKILNKFESFLNLYLKWIYLIDKDENISLINGKNIGQLKRDNIEGDKFELFDPENKSNILNLLKSETTRNDKFHQYLSNGLNKVNLSNKPFNNAALMYLMVFYEAAMNFCINNYKLNNKIELN